MSYITETPIRTFQKLAFHSIHSLCEWKVIINVNSCIMSTTECDCDTNVAHSCHDIYSIQVCFNPLVPEFSFKFYHTLYLKCE
jgi:hypothetical protein